MDVKADEDPTLIIIPGNVPHQIHNPYKETLKIFYYFPEGEFFKKEITYYFPDGTSQGPDSDWLD